MRLGSLIGEAPIVLTSPYHQYRIFILQSEESSHLLKMPINPAAAVEQQEFSEEPRFQFTINVYRNGADFDDPEILEKVPMGVLHASLSYLVGVCQAVMNADATAKVIAQTLSQE